MASVAPVISKEVSGCPVTATPCNTTKNMCENNGFCCIPTSNTNEMFCSCLSGFQGSYCQHLDYESFLPSKELIQTINLSVGISIAVGIIALVALSTVIFLIVKSRKRRPWFFGAVETEKDLDKTIIYVQEEISKLSTVQQLNKLHRLSKLFEKTVREAILSEPGRRVERQASVFMNEYLPRWSSAPSCFNRPPNDMDVTDGPEDDDDVFQKRRLQQVFSLPGQMPYSKAVTSHL